MRTKHPGGVLDYTLLEEKRSQNRKISKCPRFEGGTTVNSLMREIYCHQRELQVRGPLLFMKEPVKRMAKHLPLEEQPRARWVPSKQV